MDRSTSRAGAGYRAIADALRAAIDTGSLAPGSKVPSENELMRVHGVEQPTARRALELLKNEGLIVARRGAGTFVREFRLFRRGSPGHPTEPGWGAAGSIWQADDAQRPAKIDTIEVTTVEPPIYVASLLSLRDGEKALVRRSRHSADDVPIQFACAYYPEPLVRGSRITERDPGDGGVYARLAELGHTPVHVHEELRVRMPREAEASLLDLAQGTPVILVIGTAFTAEGKAVEVNELLLDSSSYILEYDLLTR